MEVSLLLAAGTRVGPYEVLGLLGAGGMGEVYRARDPRLGRDVALKVLPEQFAHSEDRLSRFEREARSAGRLNHPNILTVFDVGSDAGIHYLASELLEGETLRKAAAFHAIAVDRALAWTLQAAEGLACAHEAGILHRDLKPENLFLTRDGRLKILDFGLVKLVEPSSGGPREAETVTRPTEAGRRMGTAAYMSPEQIRDEPLDGRCDLFALGAILYELIARRPAFTGATDSDVIAAVLRDDPPTLAETGADVPSTVEAVVRRCLAKRREDRFRSAAELVAVLQTVIASLPTEDREPVPHARPGARPARGRRRGFLVAVMVALAGLSAMSVSSLLRRSPTERLATESPPPSFEVARLTSHSGSELEPALARDGQRVAFVWDGQDGDNFDLYTKVVGAETALRLTTHAAYDGSPAWSADGRLIAFIRMEGSRGTVLVVPSTGGAERELLDIDLWYGSSISFSPDGRHIAISERATSVLPFGIALIDVETRERRVVDRTGGVLVRGRRVPSLRAGRSNARVRALPQPGCRAPLGHLVVGSHRWRCGQGGRA